MVGHVYRRARTVADQCLEGADLTDGSEPPFLFLTSRSLCGSEHSVPESDIGHDRVLGIGRCTGELEVQIVSVLIRGRNNVRVAQVVPFSLQCSEAIILLLAQAPLGECLRVRPIKRDDVQTVFVHAWKYEGRSALRQSKTELMWEWTMRLTQMAINRSHARLRKYLRPHVVAVSHDVALSASLAFAFFAAARRCSI